MGSTAHRIFPSIPRLAARPAPNASPKAMAARPAGRSLKGTAIPIRGTASTRNAIAAMMKQSSAQVIEHLRRALSVCPRMPLSVAYRAANRSSASVYSGADGVPPLSVHTIFALCASNVWRALAPIPPTSHLTYTPHHRARRRSFEPALARPRLSYGLSGRRRIAAPSTRPRRATRRTQDRLHQSRHVGAI